MIIIMILLLILLSNIQIGHGQIKCDYKNPYLMVDNTCANFNEICFKKGDPQCNLLQDACKQCPPSNYTLTIFLNMINLIQGSLLDRQKALENKIDKLTEKNNTGELTIIIVFFLIFTVFILLLEGRFKLITKFCEKITGKNSTIQYHILQSRKTERLKDSILKLELEKIHSQLKKVLDRNNEINFHLTTKFQINDNFIELIVNNDDNVVQIKRKICTKWISAKENDDKRMKLKYNGTILDDNDYLLKQIGSNNDVINCDIDDAINVHNIIIVRLQSNIPIPEFIQINKDKTIAELKKIISKIIFRVNLSFFNDKEELKDDFLLANWIENSLIRVVEKNQGKITVKSIFNEKQVFTIEFSNIELVVFIINKISQELNSSSNELILFNKYKYLKESKYIFEYDITHESEIQFCFFMGLELVDIISENIEIGDSCTLYSAREKWSKDEIILKKYQLKPNTNIKDNKAFLNELITFQITKPSDRYVPISGVYKDGNNIYISMMKMEQGSIKQLLSTTSLNENDIKKLSKQILEGLKYLHDKNIIHRNIQPSNILIDGDTNVKLSSFGMSKYLQGFDKNYLKEGIVQSKVGTIRYMAPEILKDEKYGVQADVWSFGATVVEMVTGKQPFFGINDNNAMIKIINFGKLDYTLPENTSVQLKSFIEGCLISDPKKRSTIDDLLMDKFLIINV